MPRMSTAGLPPIDTVLFDLDGTLIDNFTAIHRCYEAVAIELGLPPKTYDDVLNAVGGSIVVTLGKLVPPEKTEAAVELYRQKFPSMMYEGLAVYPGVDDALVRLKARGYRLAVYTNKGAHNSRELLAHVNLLGRFDRVFGTVEVPWRKPDPEFTAHVLRELKSDAARTVMIGDSTFDIATARNGGLRAVHCVTTGSHDAHGLREADSVHADMSSLVRAVFGV